ncbi:MAG: hypothetical protein Q7R87_04540, partial [Nanoarchaeota archaeon]|nr:hypothetical protein [Nanoarchaeota archaeon]
KGFIEGLKLINPKPDYPIVIRRAGPRDKEAYEMIRNFAKEENIDIHLFDESTSITYPAKIMVSLSNNYKEKKNVDIN